MSDANVADPGRQNPATSHEEGPGPDADVEKSPHEGPDVNDLEADNAVEEETLQTVDPDNAPA